jgi:hypothetical protein
MGAGNPPPELAGREDQVRQFRILLGRLAAGRSEPSMIISGLRGVGKTVLLLELESIAGELGWVAPDPIEARPDAEFQPALNLQAYQALVRLDRRKRLGDRLRQAAGLLKGITVTADGSLTYDASHVTVSEGPKLERDLVDLFRELGVVARENETGIVFLVDEMQFLKKTEMQALAAAMHRMIQLQLPIALVGTGLPQLPGLLVDAKSYAERLFAYPRLDRLTVAAARDAIVKPATEQDVVFEEPALDRILELSGRYPAFLQAYGKEVWNTAPASPITLDDVRAAEPIVEARLDAEFFDVRFEKATPLERRYMAAIAVIAMTGDDPVKSGDVAKELGYKNAANASKTRDTLIRKGLIYSPDHGLVAFTVPHFAAFMRRKHPIAALGA